MGFDCFCLRKTIKNDKFLQVKNKIPQNGMGFTLLEAVFSEAVHKTNNFTFAE